MEPKPKKIVTARIGMKKERVVSIKIKEIPNIKQEPLTLYEGPHEMPAVSKNPTCYECWKLKPHNVCHKHCPVCTSVQLCAFHESIEPPAEYISSRSSTPPTPCEYCDAGLCLIH